MVTTVMGIALSPFYLLDWSLKDATMCLIMGLMAALASATSKYPRPVEEAFARRGAGVDRLVG
jgi:hypothetical protein